MFSIRDTLEVVFTMGDHEGTLKIEYDDLRMKTKLVLTHFGGTFKTLYFNEKSLLNTLLGFPPYWDCKSTNAFHAHSPGVYTSEQIFKFEYNK